MRNFFHQRVPGAALLLLLVGCKGIGDGLEPYYDEGASGPEVSGLDPSGEDGNIGGQTVRITGSNFGDDPAAVTVQFGSQNATVQSIDGGDLVVTVPRGPIEGGAVSVTVGTLDGQTTLAGGYTYEVGDLYDDQVAYVLVTNDRFSCYGGPAPNISERDVDWCNDFAFIGEGGVAGSAEFLDFVYPRFHTPSVGWWGGNDVSPDWQVQVPGQLAFTASIEDLHADVGPQITLRNPSLADEEPYCSNVDVFATYRYGGGYDSDGTYYAPVAYSPINDSTLLIDTIGEDCNAELPDGDLPQTREDGTQRVYDLSEIQMCHPTQRVGEDLTYQSDWAVADNFFESPDGDSDGVVDVELDVSGAGIDGVALRLPEYPTFHAIQGVPYADDDDFNTLWGITGFETCFDSDGDGATSLSDTAVIWQWDPGTSAEELKAASGPEVEDVQVKVRATITWFNLSWIGGEFYPIRASIMVDDAYNLDDRGRSNLELPASVLYQMPTIETSWGEVATRVGTVVNWGDPGRSDYGLIVVTMERVAEYRVNSELGGDVVFAYVTGDFGYVGWNHPLDNDACGDCLDGDGDGWTDDGDPDCARGGTDELGFNDAYTCNDGLDNDGDGDTDRDDDDCKSATDDETNCDDGIDNDEDGYIDELDGECSSEGAGLEAGDDDPDWQCANWEDDDGDGWVDYEDPDCADEDPLGEELGYGDTACNDGEDNDGHGDVDADDIFCMARGPMEDAEEPTFRGDCADGDDDDGDGYKDPGDPGCEVAPYNSEDRTPSYELTCYDGIDNGGDGDIDADDTDCRYDGLPDGYQVEDP